MNYREQSLKKHAEWKGKIEIVARVPVDSRDNLSVAYTPGVAEPCLAIQKDVSQSFELTRRWNTVPVITDGTAVLGLGDIGPEAGMPVMEGKCALFKAFGNVDAYPLCIRSKDTEEIIRTIKLLAGSWGGINLEDIAAPRCFEIESRLKAELDIPVFHDGGGSSQRAQDRGQRVGRTQNGDQRRGGGGHCHCQILAQNGRARHHHVRQPRHHLRGGYKHQPRATRDRQSHQSP